MTKLTIIARKTTLFILSVVLVGSLPMAAFAEEAATSSEQEDPGYVYDSATGRWSSNKWKYDAASNSYIENTGPASNNTIDTDGAGGSIENTGPDSTNAIKDGDTTTTQNNTKNNNQINNNVSGQASSGTASVNSNNTAGGATSGNAASIATIMNNLNSSSALSGAQPYTFSSDIYGNVYGDIELAPELLQAMANTTGGTNGNNNINYNVLNNNIINNGVNLGANSGNASVMNNTNAGNATSGSATAVANVLNVINSVIAANRSFVGTINIYGNLNGDILMNRAGSPSLIASNAASNPLSNGSLLSNNTNLTDIVNNINLNATTGKADTSGNTNAGNATTGSAKTNLVVMDLTGHQVSAKNSLLVFVNVLGKWVGIIVDAPTGATAAVLGDDVTSHLIAQTGPNSTNQINDQSQNNTTINADTKNRIANNITVDAHSGDATVSGNTNGGDATSGDASASATVMNMVNSAFDVSEWFGVLFINVFGEWDGSFGIDTESGGHGGMQGATQQPSAVAAVADVAVAPVAQVFRFISNTGPQSSNTISDTTNTANVDSQQTSPAVLSASDTSNNKGVTGVMQAAARTPQVSIPVAIAGLVGISLLIYAVIRIIGSFRDRITYSH